MLLLFLDFLRFLGIHVPTFLSQCSTRIALASLTSFCLTLVFGKKLIEILKRWNLKDRVRTKDCARLAELHGKKNETPTMGGLIIVFSLLASLFLWMQLDHIFTLILFLTTFCIGILGFVDDLFKIRRGKKGLSARKKLGVQLLFSLLIASYLLVPSISDFVEKKIGFLSPKAKEFSTPSEQALLSTKAIASRLYLPFQKKVVWKASGVGLILLGLFFIFVIAGTCNAVNLTDGLDGLATGSVLIAAACFCLIAFLSNHIEISRYLHILYIEGSSEIAVFLAAVVGSCLGFLWYNAPPAQVFMGDTGSLTLGAILGVSAVLLRREFLLALVGGVFVAEALSVILQVGSYRYRKKKRIFLIAPLHHHFEYKGVAETKVTVRFWIVGLLLAVVGILSLKLQ